MAEIPQIGEHQNLAALALTRGFTAALPKDGQRFVPLGPVQNLDSRRRFVVPQTPPSTIKNGVYPAVQDAGVGSGRHTLQEDGNRTGKKDPAQAEHSLADGQIAFSPIQHEAVIAQPDLAQRVVPPFRDDAAIGEDAVVPGVQHVAVSGTVEASSLGPEKALGAGDGNGEPPEVTPPTFPEPSDDESREGAHTEKVLVPVQRLALQVREPASRIREDGQEPDAPTLRYIEVGGTLIPLLEFGKPNPHAPSDLWVPGISARAETLAGPARLMQELGHHGMIVQFPTEGVNPNATLTTIAEKYTEAAKVVANSDEINAVGHSLGGFIVQEMAHLRTVNVQRMGILASSALRFPTMLTLPFETLLLAYRFPQLYCASNAIRNPDRTNFKPGTVYGGKIKEDPTLIEGMETLIHQDRDEHSHNLQLNMAQWGAIPLMMKNSIMRNVFLKRRPGLVVLGNDDPVIPKEWSWLQAKLMGFAVHIVRDGHLLPQHSSEELVRVLHEYLTTPVHKLKSSWRPKREHVASTE